MGTHVQISDQTEELCSFGEAVIRNSSSNLDVLRKVETAINWLVRLRGHVEIDRDYAGKVVDLVRACKLEQEIDPDDRVVTTFECAEKELQKLHSQLKAKQQSAARADELVDDHKDAIIGEYEQTIECVGHFHDLLEELRWAVMTHDGRVSGTSAPIKSAESLDDYFREI